MKRCPDCGTAFIHGGEFCSMDGAQLIPIKLPVLTGVAPPSEEVEEGPNPTLVSGTDPSRVPRPTGPVADNTTGQIGAGTVTLALSLGDTAFIGAVFAERYK